MGRGYTEGFLEMGIDIDRALAIHCSSNCFPPIHSDFIPAFREAIDWCACENNRQLVTLPNGKVLTAGEICEQAHLDAFVYYKYQEWINEGENSEDEEDE